MYNPHHGFHPGEYIRDDILTPQNMTIHDLAAQTDTSPKYLQGLNDQEGGDYAHITPKLAMALEERGYSSALMWLSLSYQYECYLTREALNRGELQGVTVSNPVKDGEWVYYIDIDHEVTSGMVQVIDAPSTTADDGTPLSNEVYQDQAVKVRTLFDGAAELFPFELNRRPDV